MEDIEITKYKPTIPLKKQLGKLLQYKKVKGTLDIINSIFSLILICTYVYSADNPTEFYHNFFRDSDGKAHFYPNMLLAIHLYFLIEYLVRLYTAKSFMGYFLSLDSIIELFCGIPFVLVSVIT